MRRSARPSGRVHGEVRGARQSAWEAVYGIVRRIPRGRVMTYGQISTILGGLLSPRAVGWAMYGSPDDVPWQRVVNAAGRISPRPDEGPELQRLLLLEEGVVFDETDRIDLARFAWEPDRGWYAAHPDFLAPAEGTDRQAPRGGRSG